jgi:hypothetical protein
MSAPVRRQRWHGEDPSKIECILDPNGVISVYQGKQIPTGRKRTKTKHYAGYGDLDPPNTRYAQLLSGELQVSALADDELMYGMVKCDDGKFSIRAAYQAAHLPRKIAGAMERELMKRADNKVKGAVLGAIDRIVEIATSPAVDDKDAFKAATWLVERAMGKTPDVVHTVEQKKYEVVIENISRGTRRESRVQRGIESNPPLEAEIVEELLED